MKTGLAAAAFIVFLLFLAIRAPLSAIVGDAVYNSRASLEAPSGSLFDGRFERFKYGQKIIGSVDWSVNGVSFSPLGVNAHVSIEGKTVKLASDVVLAVFKNQIQLANTVGTIGPDLLVNALIANARTGGEMRVQLSSLTLTRGLRPESGEGRLVWSGATITAPFSLALGTILARMQPDVGGSKIVINAQEGEIIGYAAVQLGVNGEWDLSATIVPQATSANIGNVLTNLLGPPEADGFHVARSGRFGE